MTSEGLRESIDRLESEEELYRGDILTMESSLAKIRSQKHNLLRKFGRELTTVTDHALVRYIERFLEADVAKAKQEILDGLPEELGDGKHEIAGTDGMVAVVENFKVITVFWGEA